LYVELFDRRRSVVPGVATGGRALRLALRLFHHGAWTVDDDRGVLRDGAVPPRARARAAARFSSRPAQSRRDGLRARLWRALLRTLRHAHLDRGVLDLCGGAQRRCVAWPDYRERSRDSALAARKHSGQ